MRKHLPQIGLAIGIFILAGAGCTRQLRVARHLRRAESEVAAGDYDRAEIDYETVISADPFNIKAIGRLGSLYLDEGRFVPAYQYLKKAMDGGADDPRVGLSYALACLTLGRTADARNEAKKLIQGDSVDEQAFLILVDTSVTARENEETRRIVDTLRSRAKDAPGYHLALGALLLASHDQSGAEGELRKALEMEPGSPAANEGLGNLALQRNDSALAGEYFKKAADLSPIRAPVRLRHIDFLIRTGLLDEAKRRLDEITAKAPDYIPGWVDSMRVAVAQKRYSDCLAYAEKILARDPTNYDALERRAGVKLITGDPDAAIADLKTVQGYFPRTPLIKYELAVAYRKKGDDVAAEESLRAAIQLAANYDDARVLLAEIEIEKGESNFVAGDLAPVLKRHPGEPRVELLLAQNYRLQGNFEQARGIYEAIAKAAPSTSTPQYLIGMVLFEEGRRAEARAAFERSIRISESYWPAQEMLVNLDLIEKHGAQAAERMEALVKKYPEAPDPLVFRSRVRLSLDDTDGAAADLQRAIELDPGLQYAYLHLAEIYLKTNQTEKALERLRALVAKTDSKSAWMTIGMILEQLKNFDAARDAYERLLKLDPNFEPALNNLAFIYCESLGQPEKAYDLAKKARNLAPDEPNAADTLGWILFRRGDYPGALPLIQEAAEKSPLEPGVQYHLGMANYYLGREEPARLAFEKAIAAAADSPVKADAARRLAVLEIDPEKAGKALETDLAVRTRKQGNDPMLISRLGRVQERDGDPAGAAASYESALKISPKFTPAMMSLADLYSGELKNPDRARELIKSVHELLPNDIQTTWKVARLAFQTGDYAWAATLLEEASHEVSDPDLINDLAYAAYCAGSLQEAESDLKKIDANASPGAQERARSLSAMMAAAQGPSSARSALPEARRILASEPEYIPALMVAALAREQDGDVPGARQGYEELLARDPEFSPAMRQLALLYGEKIGDDKKAEEMAMKARKSQPDDPAVNYELGAIHYRQGDPEGAVRFLEKSLSAGGDQAETAFLLGMSHYQLKEYSMSKEELQRAINLKLPAREADYAKRTLDEIQHAEDAN
jgi:tetratricopeptide (TPR) repeat protein